MSAGLDAYPDFNHHCSSLPVPQKIRRPSLEATSFLFFYHVKLFTLTWVLWEAEHAMGEFPSARPRNSLDPGFCQPPWRVS